MMDYIHETGPNANRMRYATECHGIFYLHPALASTSGTVPKNTNQTLNITGTVKGLDDQDASLGATLTL